ncbi:hypothetical protein [Streptomyces sp. NPDC088739]|uniref:hypothetical protein n=1 Tax=Streptomyces sp. NPDC088739 TaxID=3365882 RepID=UPI00382B2DA0
MEEMTTEQVRRGWATLLTEISQRTRGAVRLIRYKRPVAVLVPADWFDEAVAAIGEPQVRTLPGAK